MSTARQRLRNGIQAARKSSREAAMATCVPLTLRIWIVPLERNPARVSFVSAIRRPPSMAPARRMFSAFPNPAQIRTRQASRKRYSVRRNPFPRDTTSSAAGRNISWMPSRSR